MKTKLLLVLVLILATTTSFLIFTNISQKKGNKPHFFHQCSLLNRHLKLTAPQKQEIEKLDKIFLKEQGSFCNQVCEKRKQLSQLLLETNGNRQAIDRRVEEINFLQGELEKAMMEHIFEVKALLLPKQQQKFLSLIARELCRHNVQ